MDMRREYNNEQIGISAEIAIAQAFCVNVSDSYRIRSDVDVVSAITPVVSEAFSLKHIPCPTKHVAENQNPHDFELRGGLTLSVKTNKGALGKVAPQIIGQPTSSTYFEHFSDLIHQAIPIDHRERCYLFKSFSIENIDLVMQKYWNNLFDSDYLIYFYNILDRNGKLNIRPEYIVLSSLDSPEWNKNEFSFTQGIESWNESSTVKYKNLTIGEFQVHNNRDCFKFRFNMQSIIKLMNAMEL